jgi:8-oxo-dGTP diphosphatase
LSRKYPTRPLLGTGALIFRGGKLLLIQRGAEPGKGKWSIPGGLVELGENVQDAMVRETKEEVGLEVEALKLVDVFDSVTLDKQKRVKYHFVIVDFLARIVGGKLRTGSDILRAKWVPVEKINNYRLTKSFRTFYKLHYDELKDSASLSEK